jgi:hypothetical protein
MRTLLTVLLLLTLPACKCLARVTVAGSLAEGITFRAPGETHDFFGQGELQDLAVTMVGSNSSIPIWHIRGKSKVSAVTYGKVPSGMTAEGSAAPLEPGRTYVITVYGISSRFMPSCVGGATFAIGSDGTITSCQEGPSPCG